MSCGITSVATKESTVISEGKKDFNDISQDLEQNGMNKIVSE